MLQLEKNKLIGDKRRLTQAKRQSQVCKTYKLKIDKSRLTLEQSEQLKMYFVEAKWVYNWLLANQDNMSDINSKYKQLSHITHKDKNGNDIEVDICHIGSSVKQQLIQQILNQIKSLASLKRKGHKVGKLKFKSEFNCVPFRQYGITHNIQGNRIKLQGIKRPIKVFGLKQIPEVCDIANANLLYDGYDYYISLTCYVDRIVENKIYKNNIIGLDFGVQTSITCSNGDKIDVQVEESERLKKLQAKLARQQKRSNNWYKTKSLIRKEYTHLNNKKNDIANKIVSKLLSENETIVMQDEQINGWKNNITYSKIHHSILGRVKSKLVSKARVVVLDKWFPTTKYCSKCGTKVELSLDDRLFECPNCKTKIDRDIHAAQNMIYFYLQYKDTAGMVDTLKPVAIKFDNKFVAKQEDTTSLVLY